jgi:curved DNA-binding protein CbpA
MSRRDYYELLGLARDADAADVKTAFRQLAKQHHPDLNPGDSKAESQFKSVNEAYSVLGDSAQRQAYDEANRHAGLSLRAKTYTRTSQGADPAHQARAAEYGARGGWQPADRSRTREEDARREGGGGGPEEHVDADEWVKWQQAGGRADDFEAKMRAARRAGFAYVNDPAQSRHSNAEARRAAKAQADAWAAARVAGNAAKGVSETQHYRMWAQDYRRAAVADAAALPKLVLAGSAVLALGALWATTVTNAERDRVAAGRASVARPR